MVRMIRVPDPVAEQAEELAEKRDFQTIGEAVRAMVNEAGYEV